MKLPNRYITQTIAGHILLALAIFMALPVSKPGLWVLEIWGEMNVPTYLWVGLFAANAAVLLLTRRARLAQYAMMFAAVFLVTVAGAGYLSLGWNFGSILAAVLALHCVGGAKELKARADYGA